MGLVQPPDPEPPGESTILDQTELIRSAMLSAMGDGTMRRHPNVVNRVRYASDIQGLWYQRSEMLAALSDTLGETEARVRMADITELFAGFVPMGGRGGHAPQRAAPTQRLR
jgi:hypothetical protein